MRLLLDTSVWVEHLRTHDLAKVLYDIRGKFVPWLDAITAAELIAGCRSKRERRVVDRLLDPFRSAGRLIAPEPADCDRAARALSRLREQGTTLSGAAGALLDAMIAAVAVRLGALLVTLNMKDFEKLGRTLPVTVESLDTFRARIR